MFTKALIAATTVATLASGAAMAQSTVYTTTETNTEAKEDNARAGLVAGATAGAIVGGPVGAIVGGAIGATGGNQLTPEERVVTYVQTNPVPPQPVLIEREVVQGYVVPDAVTLTPVPETEYAYVYTDNRPVIVDANTRTVVQVIE